MKTQFNTTKTDIINWACQSLASLGYSLKSNIPTPVVETPYSYVVCFETDQGIIYLKHTPPRLALEAMITTYCRDQLHAEVPMVIAENSALQCFLTKDSGRPLRAVLKQQFDIKLYCRAIRNFTAMQLTAADHLQNFLDMGVPDWRLDKLPDLYRDFLSHRTLLRSDGLTEKDINQLESQQSKVSHWCEQLSAYAINPSIVQPDFHDNNILIDEKTRTLTFIDLGEITISHPFFSLINCLYQAKKHHGITDQSDFYAQLIEACLHNFMPHHSRQNLMEAFEATKRIQMVYAALAQHRLMIACGSDKIMSLQPGRLKSLVPALTR